MKRQQLHPLIAQTSHDSRVARNHQPDAAEQEMQELPQVSGPESLTPENIQALQSLHGNRATASLMMGTTGALSHPVQAKLTVTPAGDQYEQEADRVAAQVVGRMHEPVQRVEEEEELQMKRDPQMIQRVEDEEELQMKRDPQMIQRVEDEEELQMKRDPQMIQRVEDEEEELQMKRDPQMIQRVEDEEELQMKRDNDPLGGTTLPADVEQSIAQARGGGAPLGSDIRGSLEQHMGADFSGVRIHTGSEADALSRQVQAKAFTTGQDVFFRSDQYHPGDRSGQELIAHELTHVVQQNPSLQTKRETDE